MAQKKPTLFQQLRSEDESEEHSLDTWRESGLLRWFIIVASATISGLFFPNTINYIFTSQQNITSLRGLRWQNETVRSESSFPLTKPTAQYNAECEKAKAATPPVFKPTLSVINKAASISAVESYAVKEGLAIMKAYSNHSRIITAADAVRRDILQRGLINTPKSMLQNSLITVALSNTEIEDVPTVTVLDTLELTSTIESTLRQSVPPEALPLCVSLITNSIEPTLRYSRELTEQMQNAAAANVPRTNGIVRAGEVIVAKGEIINDAVLNKMISYGMMGADMQVSSSSALAISGAMLHAALIYSLLLLFLFFLRPLIFHDNAQLLSLSVMTVLLAFLSWLSVRINSEFSLGYLVAIPALSMLATIYFDSRTGFTLTVALSLLHAGVRANDYSSGFAMLLAGSLAVYSVRDLQSRTQLFRSIGFIVLGFFSVIIVLGMERGEQWNNLMFPLVAALINAAAAPLITFGVIALADRFAGVPSDLQLIEFDNLNHQLLIEMSEKAPGTYQHTLSIANMVETAAYSIGANPLLARVGAYFHDIGKIPKAEYFIENQFDMANKHDLLTPKKSASIIRNHIEDGIELAHEYKLPQRIVDFIPMHHGTTLIKHFYARAVEEAAEGTEIDEAAFRYPGPKPNTKETALLMLADSIEAISRTVEERDEMASMIDRVFREKINDGQLDECDITMTDLQIVKEAFVKHLMGVQHQRIQYKEIPATAEEKS